MCPEYECNMLNCMLSIFFIMVFYKKKIMLKVKLGALCTYSGIIYLPVHSTFFFNMMYTVFDPITSLS